LSEQIEENKTLFFAFSGEDGDTDRDRNRNRQEVEKILKENVFILTELFY